MTSAARRTHLSPRGPSSPRVALPSLDLTAPLLTCSRLSHCSPDSSLLSLCPLPASLRPSLPACAAGTCVWDAAHTRPYTASHTPYTLRVGRGTRPTPSISPASTTSPASSSNPVESTFLHPPDPPFPLSQPPPGARQLYPQARGRRRRRRLVSSPRVLGPTARGPYLPVPGRPDCQLPPSARPQPRLPTPANVRAVRRGPCAILRRTPRRCARKRERARERACASPGV